MVSHLALVVVVALLLSATSKMPMAKGAVINVADTEEEVAKAVAEYVANLSSKFAKERCKFTVAVAGGTLIHTLR